MNILNISQSFDVKGGSDIYFHMLTKLLRANGYDVEEFASSATDQNQFPASVNFNEYSYSDLFKYVYNLDARRKIENFLSKKKIDIAHLHIYYGMLTSSILKPLKTANIPIIQTLHEYKLVCPTYKLYDGKNICFDCKNNNFYKSVFKQCNRDSFARTALSALESYVSLWHGSQTMIDHFITVSDFQKAQIVKMGYDKHNITTVHNFVNINRNYSTYIEGSYVLYFGRIEKEKGIEVLLNAFEEIDSSIKLVIAGEGSYTTEMLMRINNSTFLSANTSYLGFKDKEEIHKIIADAKFVVVPSIWYETFGLTVIEAMAHCKPVIGSNIGGITEIIDDSVDGFLTDPNDHVLLKQKIVQLWNDKLLLRYMSENALKKVEIKFSAEAHLINIQNIYNRYL